MTMDKEFGAKIQERTHPRDGNLNVSNPTRAVDTLSGYHGRKRNENDLRKDAYLKRKRKGDTSGGSREGGPGPHLIFRK